MTPINLLSTNFSNFCNFFQLFQLFHLFQLSPLDCRSDVRSILNQLTYPPATNILHISNISHFSNFLHFSNFFIAFQLSSPRQSKHLPPTSPTFQSFPTFPTFSTFPTQSLVCHSNERSILNILIDQLATHHFHSPLFSTFLCFSPLFQLFQHSPLLQFFQSFHPNIFHQPHHLFQLFKNFSNFFNFFNSRPHLFQSSPNFPTFQFQLSDFSNFSPCERRRDADEQSVRFC